MKKKLLSVCLSVILVIFILLSQLGFFFSNVVFNKELYEKVLSNYNITDEIYNKYIDNITNFTKSRNLPETVFADVITKNDISEYNSKNIISGIDYLRGKEKSIPQSDPKEKVDKIMTNVKAYVDTLKDIEGQDKEAINNELVNIESKYTSIVRKYINSVNIKFLFLVNPENISAINNIETINNLRSIFVVLSLLLVGIIHYLNKKDILKFLNHVGYSIFISGLITFSPGLTGSVSKFYTKIPLVNEYVNQLVTGVMDQFFKYFMQTGLFLLIVGLGMIVFGFILHMKKTST